jgi:parallel beta helix pectate lyase-like protein
MFNKLSIFRSFLSYKAIAAIIPIIIIVLCPCAFSVTGDVTYVDSTASGANTGTSWEDAYIDLGWAVYNSPSGTIFWVAEGTYPENLILKDTQKLYGGFAGGEQDLSERDFRENITIIDGEKKGRVIQAANNNVIDGFTITNGTSNENYAGAGIKSNNPITIRNNIIDNNHSGPAWAKQGGGVCIKADSCNIINNVFMRNSATQWGASVFLDHVYHGDMRNNIFTDNRCPNWDGNLFLKGLTRLSIHNNIFCGNHDFARAAGIEYFGSNSTVWNNLIVGNQAAGCPAVYIYGNTVGTMENNTIAYNKGGSGAIELRGSGTFDFNNNIISFNDSYAIREILELSPPPDGSLKNNIIYENTKGGYYDYNTKKIYTTESELNSINPPGTNKANKVVDPGFTGGPSGTLASDPEFNDFTRQSQFKTTKTSWKENELVGKFINPNENQPLQFYIVKNTTDTITVWADITSRASSGDTYRIFDYHLVDGSPAISRADTSLAPDDDFDGDPRPGDDNETDIGYDEAPDSYTNVNTAPYCQVITPQGEQSTPVSIQYTLFDDESHNISIKVEYSQDGGKSYDDAIEGQGSDGTSGLSSSPSGISHTYVWDALSQGLEGYYDKIRIRITPTDFEKGTVGESWNFTITVIDPDIVQYFHFTDDEEGWTELSIPSVFTAPEFSHENGKLVITSAYNINTFGCWQSPIDGIGLEQGYLYRATYSISTNLTDPARCPLIRLRASSLNNQISNIQDISSRGGGLYSPAQENRAYSLYFSPALISPAKISAPEDIILFFDLVNMDVSDDPFAKIFLDDLTLERINPNSLVKIETEKSWDFEEDPVTGWNKVSMPSVYTAPEFSSSGGALTLKSMDAKTFGFWSTDYEQINIKKDRLYRGTFTVSTDVSDQSKVPGCRLRLSTETFDSICTLEIASLGNGYNSPTKDGKDYQLYFVPPQHIEGTELDDLLVSFDIKNFSASDETEGSLSLENLLIETFNIPE